ncbi:ATP-binding protein [Methanolobus sp.]|uniref:ATP-binding protein n=1 Tax=Methanolobus sp. TaxID=1874737 RepID=UPI0025DAED64|nr:ATP-binding protein [Methanolobus sp.]
MTNLLRIQHDVAVIVSSTNSLHEKLSLVLDNLLQLDTIDSGVIHFVEGDAKDLEFVACKGFLPKFEQYLREVKQPVHFMGPAMSGKSSLIKGDEISSLYPYDIHDSEKLSAMLLLPMEYNDKVIAVMSVCSHSTEEIPEQVVTVLELIVAHLESAIGRSKVELELSAFMNFGTIHSKISSLFMCMKPEDTDTSINKALEMIGQLTGVEKVGVFMFSDDYLYIKETHVWNAEGIDPDINHFDNFNIADHHWWRKELLTGKTFYIRNLDDLLPEAFLEKRTLTKSNINSLVSVPMEYRGKILGNLCLVSPCIGKKIDGYLGLLKLMGEVFANAIEHARKDAEIKERENRYKRIFKEIHDIYFETQMDGTILTLSPSIKHYLEFEPEELIGHSMEALYTVPSERKRVIETLKVSGDLNNHTVLLRSKSGNLIYMSVNAHLVYGVDGIPERIAGIARDVTEIKKIEKMLIEAKLLLENASKTRSEFLSMINHELRTPLSHVVGFSDVLIEGNLGPLTPIQVKSVKSIKHAGSKLFDLLTSLNQIAEIEGGRMELEITEFSLLSLLSDVQKITSPMAIKKDVDLEFNHIDSSNDSMICDRSKLHTILLNLISNAIKFTPSSGEVTVELMQDANKDLHISVNDTGIGISEDDQKVLFKPFVQLEPVLDRRHGGAGLGLALAKEFVEIQGGKIWLTSEVGKGSTFEFMIPGNLKTKDDPN